MIEDINEGLNTASECIDGYGEFFTSTTSFKHSYVIERAFMVACDEKKTSKSFIILACLLGKYNLQRIIDNFSEDDWEWIHQKNLEALRRRNAKREAEKAIDHAEEVGHALVEKAKSARSSVKK